VTYHGDTAYVDAARWSQLGSHSIINIKISSEVMYGSHIIITNNLLLLDTDFCPRMSTTMTPFKTQLSGAHVLVTGKSLRSTNGTPRKKHQN
jgi:hypothetical protein